MARVYLTGSGQTRGYATGSGVISNPARILLQEKDSHTGSYPTIARTGDPDFTGKFPSTFDDTKVINFVGGNLVYPTVLPASSFWVSGGVSTPNILQGLLAAGTSSRGVSDVHVSYTPGENISPFNESRIYIDNNSTFYATGTATGTLPGFSQKLSSKAIVSIPVNPVKKTVINFSTGTNELTKAQTFVLRFRSSTKSDYVGTGPNTGAITLSVTGSSVSDDIPGSTTTGGTPTSTYAFVFTDGATGTGSIADLDKRQRVVIDLKSVDNDRIKIAQAFVTGVNNLTNSPFFAEYTYFPNLLSNNLGNSVNVPSSTPCVVVRNRNPGIPLKETNANTKITTTTLSYTNGGPSCDGSEGFDTTSVLTGTILCLGSDQNRYATNEAGISAGINSGLAYFNWVNKKWELIGDHRRGRNVDFLNSEAHIVTASMLSVVPSQYWNGSFSTLNITPINNLMGLPSDTAGFPLSTKFDATGSQVLSMSGVINSPMLVEKISFDFTGALGNGYFTSDSQCANITFMLILQRDQPLNRQIEGTFDTLNFYLGYQTSPTTRNFQIYSKDTFMKQQLDRRIVWFGRLGKYNNSTFSSLESLSKNYPEIYESCESWVPGDNLTGSFRISSACKVAGKTPRATPFYDTREDSGILNFFGIKNSGRNLEDISDGRSFIASVVGSQPSSSIVNTDPSFIINIVNTGEGTQFIKTFKDVVNVSPFVLLPQDKLILAVANQTLPDVVSNNTREYFAITENGLEIAPGNSSLTLFGSLLRNNLPVGTELNQPLNSDAVHEALHYDNPVFDQFDVEPYTSLTGSYIDHIITGTMRPYDRRIVSSVVAGQAGTTGSLQRFVRLNSLNDQFYDSIVRNFTASNGKMYLPMSSSYGLARGKNLFASMKFRRDKFGQFSDILEGVQNMAFVTTAGNKVSIERPIEIKFLSRPGKDGKGRAPVDPFYTFSQNLDNFSTSSLPFFDADKPAPISDQSTTYGIGNGRDRTDYPDKWLRPTEVK